MANQMDALGELICILNPYTELPPDPTTNVRTGGMQLCEKEPAHVTGDRADSKDIMMLIDQIRVEVESNYGAEWSFKGQTHRIRAAVRIPYRFPVTKGKHTYWQTESLLIGFSGDQGGG